MTQRTVHVESKEGNIKRSGDEGHRVNGHILVWSHVKDVRR